MSTKLNEFLNYLHFRLADLQDSHNGKSYEQTLYHGEDVENMLEEWLHKGHEIASSEGHSDLCLDSENSLVIANDKDYPNEKKLRCPECDSRLVIAKSTDDRLVMVCSGGRMCPCSQYVTLRKWHYPI